MQYNNPYLTNPYLPMYNQGQPVMPQPVNGIIKVNGPQSAMQIQLPPNSTSQPMIDSNFDGKHGVFYVVSTDGTGTKTIEYFDFSPHVEQPVTPQQPDYVTRSEFQDLVNRINQMTGGTNGADGSVPTAG